MANQDKENKGASWGSISSTAEENLAETNAGSEDDRETILGSPVPEDITVTGEQTEMDNEPFEEVGKRKRSSSSSSPNSLPNASKRTNLAVLQTPKP